MTTAPYFPLYLKDWLMDTRGFTHEDKGVLMDLLVIAWERGGLPTESESIRRLAGCSKAAWGRAWPTVLHVWEERDGVFVYPKLEAARAHMEQRSARAKAKAQKRWIGDGPAFATAMLQHSHSNADAACSGNACKTTDNRQQTTETKIVCPEALPRSVPPPPPEPDEPTALRFPTVGPRSSWPLPASQLVTWSALFPHLDVLAECRQALAWVLAQPDRRKTARGMPAFLVRWLGRSADRGRGAPSVAPFHAFRAPGPPTKDNPKATDLLAARAAKMAANALEDAAERAAAEAEVEG